MPHNIEKEVCRQSLFHSHVQVSEHLLSIYLDEYPDTPWDALKYLVSTPSSLRVMVILSTILGVLAVVTLRRWAAHCICVLLLCGSALHLIRLLLHPPFLHRSTTACTTK